MKLISCVTKHVSSIQVTNPEATDVDLNFMSVILRLCSLSFWGGEVKQFIADPY